MLHKDLMGNLYLFFHCQRSFRLRLLSKTWRYIITFFIINSVVDLPQALEVASTYSDGQLWNGLLAILLFFDFQFLLDHSSISQSLPELSNLDTKSSKLRFIQLEPFEGDPLILSIKRLRIKNPLPCWLFELLCRLQLTLCNQQVWCYSQ